MALLEMVNSVRGKLREDRISTISSTDLLTTEVIDLINDAGSEILEGQDWDFDIRHDGRLWYPSSQSGTALTFSNTTIPTNTDTALLDCATADTGTGEVFDDTNAIGVFAFRAAGNNVRSRLVVSGISHANTSWIISDVDYHTTWITLTVSNDFRVSGASTYSWTIYGNEVVLPSTVKEVLSVRNEEEPIQLEFVNSEIEFDRYVPRRTDSYSSIPDVIMVGGTITSTARSASVSWPQSVAAESASTGIGCMAWPIPNADVHLQYSYRVQHSDLSADTDAWTGVPSNVIHLIEWRAFQMALESGIQSDPQAARQAERQVEKRLARALKNQNRQPLRRRIPTAFGARRTRNTRHRWASQTITAP